MLDIETNIARQAEFSRDRRYRIARYKDASWLRPVKKIALFRDAFPASEWPVDELAIIAALLSGIGIVGMVIY